MSKILIVEDEELINELIKENLSIVGHECVQAYDGDKGLHLMTTKKYDLIILDIMLPGKSGLELLPHRGECPVILVTAKASVIDRVKGLNQGAEDYIVKPFDMLELIARVNVVLRRNQKENKKIIIDQLEIDLDSKLVTLDGKKVELTPKEFDLLEVFILNKNIALSRERLIEIVWGYCYEGDTRTVDVHVVYLRKKLNLERRLKTVYKLGYRLEL